MAVCGVLSGANSFASIHEFALDRKTWFARSLDLTNGIPSVETFGRVLARLNPAEFEQCLWTGVLQIGRTQAKQSPRSPIWRSKRPAKPGGIQGRWIMS